MNVWWNHVSLCSSRPGAQHVVWGGDEHTISWTRTVWLWASAGRGVTELHTPAEWQTADRHWRTDTEDHLAAPESDLSLRSSSIPVKNKKNQTFFFFFFQRTVGRTWAGVYHSMQREARWQYTQSVSTEGLRSTWTEMCCLSKWWWKWSFQDCVLSWHDRLIKRDPPDLVVHIPLRP